VVVVKYDSQCCGVEPSGHTTKQPNGFHSGICSKCLRITDFNERPDQTPKSFERIVHERLKNIDDKLDRIEQLVMKFWDVPESGFDVMDEEKDQPQK